MLLLVGFFSLDNLQVLVNRCFGYPLDHRNRFELRFLDDFAQVVVIFIIDILGGEVFRRRALLRRKSLLGKLLPKFAPLRISKSSFHDSQVRKPFDYEQHIEPLFELGIAFLVLAS